jgi:hypothetical protein
MKKLFFLIGLVFTLSVTFAQNKKAEKEAVAKAQFEKALAAIEAKDFVIIVDTYEAASGTIETNTDATNFLSCEGGFVFFQGEIVSGTYFPHKLTVSDYNQVIDKKGNVRINMTVRGSLLSAKVEIFLKKGGNYADVNISQTSGGTLAQKKGETTSQPKSEILTSRGSEAALPSVGEGFTSSSRNSSSNGRFKQFSGEIIPRSESKYTKRPGEV